MATNVVPIEPDSSRNFSWSFKPLLTLMQCLGIHLHSCQQILSNRRRCWLRLHQTFVFLINAGSMIHFGSMQLLRIPWSVSSSTQRGIVYAMVFMNISFVVVTHLILLVRTAVKWEQLWLTLQEIGNRFQLNSNHFRQCRKVVVVGLLAVILVGFYSVFPI